MSFTERMSGFLCTDGTADFSVLEARGRGAKDKKIEFTLTIASEDLNAMLDDEAHEAAMIGTLSCPALADCPMTITRGQFNLFVKNPNHSRERRMVYRASLRGANGEVFCLHGVKVIKPGLPTNVWHDTTTLYVTISRSHSHGAEHVFGKGILHIAPIDFLRQLRTFEVTNTPSIAKRLRALARYVKYFAGVLFATYGNVFARR